LLSIFRDFIGHCELFEGDLAELVGKDEVLSDLIQELLVSKDLLEFGFIEVPFRVELHRH
jgi:hypothetical protein